MDITTYRAEDGQPKNKRTKIIIEEKEDNNQIKTVSYISIQENARKLITVDNHEFILDRNSLSKTTTDLFNNELEIKIDYPSKYVKPCCDFLETKYRTNLVDYVFKKNPPYNGCISKSISFNIIRHWKDNIINWIFTPIQIQHDIEVMKTADYLGIQEYVNMLGFKLGQFFKFATKKQLEEAFKLENVKRKIDGFYQI